LRTDQIFKASKHLGGTIIDIGCFTLNQAYYYAASILAVIHGIYTTAGIDITAQPASVNKLKGIICIACIKVINSGKSQDVFISLITSGIVTVNSEFTVTVQGVQNI
jgi:hypothetical protein